MIRGLSVRIYLLVISLALFAASSAALADDHGDTYDTATALTVGAAATSGEIEVLFNSDYFSFTATEGVKYSLVVTLGTLSYSYVYLYDSDGTTQLKQETNATTLECKTGEYGTYYIKVYGTSYTGTYTVSVTTYTDDHGNDYTDATPVTPDSSSVSGNIEVINEDDWFSFSAVEGTTYSIDVLYGSIDYAFIELYDTDGVSELQSGMDDMIWKCPEGSSGTYYVKVDTLYNDTGTYAFKIISYDDDHENVYTGATPVTVGTAATDGNIEIAGDNDWFSFSAVEGTDYIIKAEPGTVQFTRVTLYDTNGTSTILYGSPGLTWTCQTGGSGTYYVNVYAYSSYMGTYSFSVSTYTDDHGNDYTGATSVTVGGSSVTGEVEVTGDTDWFSFAATEGVNYSIQGTSDSFDNIRFIMYDTNGTTTLSSSNTNGLGWTCPTGGSGTYYINLYGSSTEPGTYSLSVSTYTDDHASDYTAATSLTVGADPVSGEIEVVGDTDWFSFSATEGSNYYMVSNSATSSYDTSLTLYNTNGTSTIIYGTESLAWTCPTGEAGTYYVKAYLSTYSGYTGAYTISVGTYTDDHGNDYTNSTSVTAGGSAATGEIEVGGDIDYFSFYATENTDYSFKVLSNSIRNQVNIYLYNKNGISYLMSDYFGMVWHCGYGRSGTYYVKIYTTGSDIGTYSLAIDTYTDDHDNYQGNGTALTVDASATDGDIEVFNEYDYFTFDATEGTGYSITATSDSLSKIYITLYDAAGSYMIGGYSGLTFTCPTGGAGTYYIKTNMYAYYTGSYSVSVATFTDDHGNDYDAATSVTAGATATDGDIEAIGDTDWFSFSATESTNYSFKADQGTFPSPYLYIAIYDIDGTTLLTSSTKGGVWTCPTGGDGTYYIKIYTSSSREETGSYKFSIATYTDDYGNDYTIATPITIGGSAVTGNVEVSGDYDWFSFSATEGTDYAFSITTDSFDYPYVYLYDTNGTSSLGVNSINGAAWTCPTGASGTYYAKVQGSSSRDDTGSYSLSAAIYTDDHGNDYTDATSVTVGAAAVSGEVEVIGDSDWFSFNATEGTDYVLLAETTAMSRVSVDLYDADGSSRIEYDTSDVSFTCLKSATYYVKVYGNATELDKGAYTFSVNSYTGDDIPNNFFNATHITVGTPQSGTIEAKGDEDWFSFNAVEGTDYVITTGGAISGNELSLYQRNGYSWADDDDHDIAWTCPEEMGGIYYLRVEADTVNNGTGTYSVSISGFTDDIGNDTYSAQAVTVGTSATGTIDAAGDEDWFSFPAEDGNSYTITVTGGTLTQVELYFTGTGDHTESDSGSASASVTWTCDFDSTYYVKVESKSNSTETGTYTVSIAGPSSGGGGGGGGCFVATASYEDDSAPSLIDAIIKKIKGIDVLKLH